MSLPFKHGDKDLHYGFIVSLLNDLFGNQVCGGYSFAGPYGPSLLGIDVSYSQAIKAEIERANTVLRPGWVRLNFNYFIDKDEYEYLLRAVEVVASIGWKMLAFYQVDIATGVWRFNGQLAELIRSLDTLSFGGYCAAPREKKVKK